MSLKLRLKYLINISPANAIQSVLIAHFYRLWSFTWWQVTFQLITNLDPNKAHAYDEISVKMIKPRAPSICKLLTLLSENCLASGHFPDVRKKCNKKSLAGVFIATLRKTIGKILFNSIFDFIDTRNMLSVHQSGFCAGDSCVQRQKLNCVSKICFSNDEFKTLHAI